MFYGCDSIWGFGWIFGFVFWVLVIVFIVSIVKWVRRGGPEGRRNNFRCGRFWRNSALSILEERYAKGEIDKKEFEEKKKDLE